MEPLFLTPYFRPKIWGGRKLNTVLGYDIESGFKVISKRYILLLR